MKTDKKAFVMYQDFWNTVKTLSMIDRGRLLTAAYEYHGTGSISFEPKGKLEAAWSTLLTTLERDAERYEARCRANSENGKKGGRPKRIEEVGENQESEV